jgi:hypothetical protein
MHVRIARTETELGWIHLLQMAGILAVILVGMAMVFCFG